MIATLAAGSAVVFFVLATILMSLSGFDRGAAVAGLVGLACLSVAVAALAVDRRPH